MFTPIGRRLALLNAAVVVAVIAVVGAAIFLLLRQSLDSEADQALAERADSALETWANRFPRGRPGASATPAAAHPAPPTARPAEDQAVLESGDVLLFAVAPDGAILAASTEKPIPGLPDRVGIAVALTGRPDARTVPLLGEHVRLYTEPVKHDGQIAVALSSARSRPPKATGRTPPSWRSSPGRVWRGSGSARWPPFRSASFWRGGRCNPSTTRSPANAPLSPTPRMSCARRWP